MKVKILILLACLCLMALTSCSQIPYVLVNAPKNPTPLQPGAVVRVVDAAEIPVIPENNTYLGTVQTNDDACSLENSAQVLLDVAQSVGANLIYIKKFSERDSRYSDGIFSPTHCDIVTADLLYVDFGGAE
jgi:hypothetical protein